MEPKNMKECDKRKSHISNKFRMICISSNNDRHPVTKTFTTLHPTTLHYTSPNYTSLHFTTLSFGLTPFKFPTALFHLTSLHFTSLHFTALLGDIRHTSLPLISPVYSCFPNSVYYYYYYYLFYYLSH